MVSRLKPTLYLICGLTDFASFVVVFAFSRSLAEMNAEPWYLGVAGAGLSFSAGIGNLLGGWLSHRFSGSRVFVVGTLATAASIALCGVCDPCSIWYLPGYWLLGVGLGFVYPPLIGWLNEGEDAHANRQGVSRTLILFCISWNLGMMAGQLTAGELFKKGAAFTYGSAFAAAVLNFIAALFAVWQLGIRSSTRRELPPMVPENLQLASAFKRLSWIANLGGMFGGSLVLHLLPDLMVAIHVAPETHGQLLAGWRGVIIATYLLMHFAGFWHYRLTAAIASQLLGAAGLTVIACAESIATLFLGLALLGQLVGYNYFSGLFYSTAGSAHEKRALAAGIHEATLSAGMAVGTIVGGALGTYNHRVPYVMAALVMVTLVAVQGAAWWIWVRGPGTRQAAADEQRA